LVLSSLFAALTLTSGLLLALAPPPLVGEAPFDNLWAAERAEGMDAVFKTHVTAKPGQWQYIFIHQSGQPSGREADLTNHFVIGNGRGWEDGQIQMTKRWNEQLPAEAPPGAKSIDPSCITIDLVGNLDQQSPTPMQLRRLAQLVSILQSQLGIGGDKVVMVQAPGSAAGIGNHFPESSLRQQLLP
jgi:N-acetylmuramoyl-L-alanine amidase